MSLADSFSRVCDELQDRLVELAKDIPSDGLHPHLFRELVGHLKACVDDAGLCSLQAFIASQEEVSELIEHDGRKYRFKEATERDWLTPFGLLRVTRRYFQQDHGGQGIVPLDNRCGMENRYMTPDIEEACALGSALLVPREVEALMEKVLPYAPSATAIQRVMKQVGGFAEKNADQVEEAIRTKAPLKTTGQVLVASWDGVTVPLREKGNKMGKPKERPGKDEPDKIPTAWREAGVGTVSIYERGTKTERAVRKDSRYFARMPESGMKTLMQQVEGCVEELRAERDFAELVVVCDGKPAIWKSAELAPCFKGATFVLDFYHAAEHLSAVAEAIFGKKSDKGKKWYLKYRSRLKDTPDGVTAMLRSLQRYELKAKRGSERRRTIRRSIGYFTRNKARMRYFEFRTRGLPIGSGPVEAACKTVVGARLKRSGMRWSRGGGQQVLNMRVQHLSQTWRPFWDVYMAERLAA